MEPTQLQQVKLQIGQLGTSYYKYVDPFIINIKDLIGSGTYGQVFKGADGRTGRLVAVKAIPTKRVKSQDLQREIHIMKAIKHPNIIELYDVKKSSNNIYLFVQLCEGGSLQKKLGRPKPQSEVILIARQLISGYKALYDEKIVHRDLKPANILISNQTYKLGDFGFARYMDGGNEDKILNSRVGSPMYMCPQILKGQQYSSKSDVWSMGLIFYQMLFGYSPFKASSFTELVAKVNSGILRYPSKISNPILKQLLQDMLKFNPDQRISWKEIFNNDLFMEKVNEEEDIRRSINLAEKLSSNPLNRSQQINQLYFNKRLVIQPIELASPEPEPSLPMQNVPLNNNQMYPQLEARHLQAERRRERVRLVRNWFLLKRNKAVFLNHLSMKLHNCFSAGLLCTDLAKAEELILVLSKWQCMITFKCYSRINDGTVKSDSFTNEDFQMFLERPIKKQLLQKFKNDFKIMKLFFDELAKKVRANIQKLKLKMPLSQRLKLIEKICDSSLCPEELISHIYAQAIDELSEICRKSMQACSIKSQAEQNEIVRLAYLVHEAVKLKTYEFYNNEYTVIYEREIKLSIPDLIQRINGGKSMNSTSSIPKGDD